MDREKLIKKVIVDAGKITLRYLGKIGVKYTKKNAGDVVTEADLISNKFLSTTIKKHFPNDGIISEEENAYQTDAEYVWVIDPIDGTMNYSRGAPLYGVMIGIRRDDKMLMAAIYLPYFDDLYFAKKGSGAFKNGSRIHCSDAKDLPYSVGCTGSIWNRTKKTYNDKLIEAAGKEAIWISSIGSTAVHIAYVAEGRRDWITGWGGGVWDYAPGSLLLAEAGCIVSNLKGKPMIKTDTQMVASNPKLHKKLLALTKDIDYKS